MTVILREVGDSDDEEHHAGEHGRRLVATCSAGRPSYRVDELG